MERFAKTVNGFKPLTIFAKHSIWDIWEGSEYAADRYLVLFLPFSILETLF